MNSARNNTSSPAKLLRWILVGVAAGLVLTAAHRVIGTNVEISEDGTVKYTPATGNGQIQLVQFVNPRGLRIQSKDIYRETEQSGPAWIGTPGASGLGQLIQGHLEARPEQAVVVAGL
jgi:hypothetical protein